MSRVLLLLGPWLLTACVTTTPYPNSPADLDEAARINTQLGIDYMRKGDTERARSKLQRALEQNPDLALAHSSIAFLYQKAGEPLAADRHYLRAIALEPDSPDTHNNYGVFLCGQSRYDAGIKAFDRALRIPGYRTPEVALTNAGVCARKAGNDVRAEQYFRAALRENSAFSSALAQIALLSYEQGEYLRTRAFLQRYAQAAQHNPQTLWLGVRTERALGDTQAARAYGEQLKQKFPGAEETDRFMRSQADG